MSENVFSFFKQNVGEEDVIKLLLLSAGKALVTVAILLSAILSYFKLCEWYGSWFVTLLIGIFTVYVIWSCSYQLSESIGIKHRFDTFNYKTWRYVFNNLLPLNKSLYFDGNEIKNGSGIGSVFGFYAIAWMSSILFTFITFIIGLILIYLYAFIISLRISIEIPPESLLVDITLILSVVIMSILFLKLKWRKIWLDGFNLNLAAWCVCAAFVITTISFVAGVAIRGIAGFIGIEYTAILVSAYVIITAIYVYLDLKQWLANKEYMARIAARNEPKVDINSLNSIP
jgi:hypothetical protein